MFGMDDLYQELVLEHKKHPRNQGDLDTATHHADGHNPLCGDELQLHLLIEDGVVKDVRFTGQGCAISTASASMMTEAIKGQAVEKIEALLSSYLEMVAGEGPADKATLGKLVAFSGVRQYPNRVKCATLAWHTLKAALDKATSVS